VPSPLDEDLRRAGRERRALITERVRHSNRIKGLLAQVGIAGFNPLRPDAKAALAGLRGADGKAVPAAMARQIGRELDRLALLGAQIAAVEAERDAALKEPAAGDAQAPRIARLAALKSIGIETATVLGREVFWREFANRRRVGGYVGLGSSPWQSGGMDSDQGISKAGNAAVRAVMIELAWRWLRFQPDSALSQWFRARVGQAGSRARRIAITALARKLLVALWRYLETGLVPHGAVFK
jgi:transposase